jgi:hypothetical protein
MGEPRNPVRDALRFEQRPATSRLLIIGAGLCVLLLVGIIVSYLAKIPPAHILIIGLGIFWVFGRQVFRRRKS